MLLGRRMGNIGRNLSFKLPSKMRQGQAVRKILGTVFRMLETMEVKVLGQTGFKHHRKWWT